MPKFYPVSTFDFLKALAPVALISGAVGGGVAHATPFTLIGFTKPAAAFAALPMDSLAKGLERGEMAPLDPGPLFKTSGCGFLQHSLLTGGVDNAQPLWNLTTLMATWLEGGYGLAHKLGNLHAGYDRESTDRLWERKGMERTSRGLGWPSCGAVQAAGGKQCAGCQHFGKIKSPLNLTKPVAPVPQAVVAGSTAGSLGPVVTAAVITGATGVAIPIPYGFVLDSNGFVCKVIPATATQPGDTVRVFNCLLSLPFATLKGTDDQLNFVATVDKGSTVEVSLSLSIIQAGGVALHQLLGEKRVKVNTLGKRYVEEFMASWIALCHEAQASQAALPFGWLVDNNPALPKTAGDRHGFVYAGLVHHDDGTVTKSGLPDPRLRQTYTPVGSADPWFKACKMIVDQKRPELDVLIAAAFAAPLMIMTGKDAVLLSGWGETGCGKSSAADVGMAVWGHLKRSKEVAKSTPKSVLEKMGSTKNLPLYWDEVGIADESIDSVFNTYFDASHGIGMSRLNTKIDLQARAEWQTMMIAMANTSFVDYVVTKLKTSGGGMYRVLEYEILHRDVKFGLNPDGTTKAPGQINQLEAARIITELGTNYGQIGDRYARMLGRNVSMVDRFVCKVINDFDATVKGNQDERYWLAACGTLLAGAELANQIGACFDLPSMRLFLKDVYIQNRKRMAQEAVAGGTEGNTMEALAGFFKEYLTETLWTDTCASGKGKPGPITFLGGPPANYPKPIQIHWVANDRLLRLCRREFLKYLHANKIPSRVVLMDLERRFGSITKKATIAAGTTYQCVQEQLICIPVPVGSPLEDQMFSHSTGGTPSVPATPATPVETGLSGVNMTQAAADLALVQSKTP